MNEMERWSVSLATARIRGNRDLAGSLVCVMVEFVMVEFVMVEPGWMLLSCWLWTFLR